MGKGKKRIRDVLKNRETGQNGRRGGGKAERGNESSEDV